MPTWGEQFAAQQLAQEYTSQGRAFAEGDDATLMVKGSSTQPSATTRTDEAKAAKKLAQTMQNRQFNAELFAYALMHDGVTEQAFETALAIVRETLRRFVEGQAFSEKDSDYGVMAGFMLDGLAQMDGPKARHRRR
jgi:hypothetical protein